jgi:hypothetical protein
VKVTEAPDGTVTVDTSKGRHAKTVWDGETISVRVVKAVPEKRMTVNVIYPADKADVAVALDGHRDFAPKQVVEDAAHNYLRKYRIVGSYHADVTGEGVSEGAAELVESGIHRGPDWIVDDTFVVKEGDWVGAFIWTPDAWADIKAGKLNGVSVEGSARRRRPDPAAVAGLRD